jgi:hypothetical protein
MFQISYFAGQSNKSRVIQATYFNPLFKENFFDVGRC